MPNVSGAAMRAAQWQWTVLLHHLRPSLWLEFAESMAMTAIVHYFAFDQ
jgi:hypothetical protein